MPGRESLSQQWYMSYLAACNDRRFEDLARYVHPEVDGSLEGSVRGVGDYVAGVRRITDAFPDYRWTMERLVIEGEWIAALVHGAGTHQGEFLGIAPTGRTVMVQEMVFYRVVDGKLTVCRGDLDVKLRDALASPGT
ncbi:ester cyclase [Curtobacterium sp. MCPF17_047]|uniref:ester cyclase n=1 Tax=Curtobacterium sp. MCPF17_047 TaxID=2175654 RepID=UPI000DAA6F80|nr:ester cyclase [Curtobacterium sp. MCPF17_047]PZF68961.1 ester cyclase [Curtobacterium sp. MCPF17_047]